MSAKTPAVMPELQHQTLQPILNTLIDRPWFSRVWVLQELVLSKDPWLQCGSKRVKWSRFDTLMWEVSPIGGDFPVTLALDMSNIRLEYQRQQINKVNRRGLVEVQTVTQNPATDLFRLLSARRARGVSEPVDILYGHLGIVHPTIRSSIQIDYTSTIRDTLTNIACIYLSHTHDVWSLLSHVELKALEERLEILPSWVPNVVYSTRSSQQDILT